MSIHLLDALDFSCLRLRLIIKLCSKLSFSLNFTIDKVSLGLSDVIWLEGEALVLEIGSPEGNHLSKATWSISSCKDSGFCHSLGLNKHIDAAVNLSKNEIGFEGYIVFAIFLCLSCQFLQALLVAIA